MSAVFSQIVAEHLEQFAELESRVQSEKQKLAEALHTSDIETLAVLSRGFDLQRDCATLKIRMQLHIGSAFNTALTLADALGAKPDVLAVVLGVDPAITLQAWLMRGAVQA